MKAMTDQEATSNFSANVLRLLARDGHSIYWLMVKTGYSENRLYPAVKGKAKPSAGMITTVAATLNVSCDELLGSGLKTSPRKKKS